MRAQESSLQFALDHRDRLVHPCRQECVHVVEYHIVQGVRQKMRAGIVPVYLRRKDRQRTQIQPVAVLQYVIAVVRQRDPDHIRHQRRTPGSRAHPADVVIAPLDVHPGVCHQLVHDPVGARSPVVDVQPVHRQPPDQRTHRRNEGVRHPRLQNRRYDLVVVEIPVDVVRDVEQLVEDVRISLRHLFPHRLPRVFRTHRLTHQNQPI